MANLPELLQIELDALFGGLCGLLHNGVNRNLRAAGSVPVEAGLDGSYKVAFKRVRALWKSQGDVDASIRKLHVLNHSKSSQGGVPLCGVSDLSKPGKYLIFVHFLHCFHKSTQKTLNL